ncbi:hypothetical protein PV08_12026 [Exophiala spinifera]|uniref:Uncharacterized protein n=1 Tax=Exophiala spinifera TaxID=91928 RepID=A0A0D1Z9S5_9EURO|nr:uncharacterized protein PV08_12026 [Exophiala spinifera]KIW09742.1 hypothetical protein PV08_12026 [Exophiala spinifera]
MSLTAKRLHFVTRELIYKAVFLSSPRATICFARTLSQHPELASLVRYFEAGAGERHIDIHDISDPGTKPTFKTTIFTQEEIQKYFLPPLRRWHSVIPGVVEDLQSNQGAIWVSGILSRLHGLTEVELQLGRSAQYLNRMIKWSSVEAKGELPFTNLVSLSLFANEDAGVDVKSILRLPSLEIFRSWSLRGSSLPNMVGDITSPLRYLGLFRPYMDEAEVVSLLRCCQELRQFELQPILGMTPGVPWYHAKAVAQGISAGLYHCRQTLEVLTIDTWTTSTPAQPVDFTGYQHLTKLTLPATEAVKLADTRNPPARMALFPKPLKCLVLVMAQRGRTETLRSALLQYVTNQQLLPALRTLDVIWERSHTSKVPELREIEDACACRGIIFSSRLSDR